MIGPVGARAAIARLSRALKSGTVEFGTHAARRMATRGISVDSVLGVLRFGTVSEAYWENGQWRHEVEARNIKVVIAFNTTDSAFVITVHEV